MHISPTRPAPQPAPQGRVARTQALPEALWQEHGWALSARQAALVVGLVLLGATLAGLAG